MGLFTCCTLQHHNHAEPVFDSGGRQHAKQQEFEAAAPIVSICEWLCGSCHQWCNPLVLLLIAPLGLAAVLSCTGLVAVLSFVLGVVADLWLWHGLNPRIKRRAATELNDWPMPEGRIGLAPRKSPEELPMRRNP